MPAAKTEAKATEATEAKAPETKDDAPYEFVKHTPVPGYAVRFISEADWNSLGIKQGDSEWNEHNRYRIPAEDFSAKALNYLKADGGFEIVTD